MLVKKRYKYTFLLLFSILIGLVTNAQSPQQNLDKYYNYKDRFENKFIVKKTITFPENRQHEVCGVNLPAEIYNTSPTLALDERVNWADATAWHGFYLAQLATEYKLLKDYGQNLIGIKTDIANALQKIEILDLIGTLNYLPYDPLTWTMEGFEFPIANFTLDGFLIRDDVPDGFLGYWNNKGYPFNSLDESSDYIADNPRNAEMSQDQVWHLLLGLALIKHMVDDNEVFATLDNDIVTLQEWSVKITKRLINYMTKTGCWEILNPVSGDVVMRGGSSIDIYRSGFGYLFKQAHNWITNGAEINNLACSDYQFAMVHPTNTGYNDKGRLILSVISGTSYADGFDDIIREISKQAAFWNGGIQPFPANECSRFTFEYLPLIYLLLHDDVGLNSTNIRYLHFFMSFVENILNIAPENGPYCYRYDTNGDGLDNYLDNFDYPNVEWSVTTRLSRHIGYSFNKNGNSGEYNGLDYMLLHNLYLLAQKKLLNANLLLTDNFPATYDYLYNYGDPEFEKITVYGENNDEIDLNIYSLKNISANNIISSTGKVTYCGNKVTLLPGFKAEKGCNFSIKPNNVNNITFGQSQKASKISTIPANALIKYGIDWNTNYLIDENKTIDDKLNIKLYPKPVVNSLEIKVNCSDKYNYSIHNLKGEKVMNGSWDGNTYLVDVSSLSKGVYFLNVANNNGYIFRKKLIK